MIITPQSERDLANAVASAKAPLVVQGGGTRQAGDVAGDILHTGGLAGITLYEPAALTLVVKSGTLLRDVETLLAGERQRLGFEPPDFRALLGRAGQSTIGGVVAANAAGPRAVQLGAARDALLGVRFVDGRGDVIASGGRVMKNVTGYDLVKLLAGSYGALGVLTEVSLKVQSCPEAEATLIFDGMDDAAGLTVLRAAMGSPYDVTGAARANARSYIRIEGLAGSVEYRAGHLSQLGGAQRVDGAASAALWRDLRDLSSLHGIDGDVWCITTLPTDAAPIAASLGATALAFDHGGARIWAVMPQGADNTLRTHLGNKGQAIKLRGAQAAPFAPQSAEVARLSAALKAQFDPFGRFAQQVA
jgi:glycolate oxidase FAD binding subunit